MVLENGLRIPNVIIVHDTMQHKDFVKRPFVGRTPQQWVIGALSSRLPDLIKFTVESCVVAGDTGHEAPAKNDAAAAQLYLAMQPTRAVL